MLISIFLPDYGKSKEKVYIKYLDMNNLYGKAMSEYLPYGGFKWVKVNNKVINRILNGSADSSYGYFLEVDLECPENLHDKQNDFAMVPQKIKVTEKMLAPNQLKIKKRT